MHSWHPGTSAGQLNRMASARTASYLDARAVASDGVPVRRSEPSLVVRAPARSGRLGQQELVESLHLVLDLLLDFGELGDLLGVLHACEQLLLNLDGRLVDTHDLPELGARRSRAVHQRVGRGAVDHALVRELALVRANVDLGVGGLLELHEVHRDAGARARQRTPVRLGQAAIACEVEDLELRGAAATDRRGKRLSAVALDRVAVEEELPQIAGRLELVAERDRLGVAPAELAVEERVRLREGQLVQRLLVPLVRGARRRERAVRSGLLTLIEGHREPLPRGHELPRTLLAHPRVAAE